MKRTKKIKVVLAVTLKQLPDPWGPAEALNFVREAVLSACQAHGLATEIVGPTVRVAAVTEETVYDASVGGKRGHKGRAGDDPSNV